jgi:hypothetical protein
MKEFNKLELRLEQEALDYIIQNKEALINHFVKKFNSLTIGGVSLFMAGSPGAGKTEFVKRYIPAIFEGNLDIRLKATTRLNKSIPFIHIDVDEIRTFIPQYQITNIQNNTKGNAEIIQKAANKGLDIIRDYCLKNNISFIHDGTFGNYSTMKSLISKSLSQNRDIHIYYIYVDPIIAWNYTVAREYTEGRNIVKDKFIDQFFQSQQNIIRIQKDFKEKVNIHIIIKDNSNKIDKYKYNVKDVALCLSQCKADNLMKIYTLETLQKEIEEL